MGSVSEQDVVNVLNSYVIVVCLVLKCPQMYNILMTSSAKSLSFSSVLLEFYAYSCCLLYQAAKGHPLGTYLEYVFLCLQDVILLTLIVYHQNLFNLKLAVAIPIYLAAFFSVFNGITPDWVLVFIVRNIGPVMVFSRAFQWYAIYKSGDSGQVSPVTWGMTLSTSMSRFATNLLVINDYSMMANQILSSSLALIMMLTVLYYRKEEKKKSA